MIEIKAVQWTGSREQRQLIAPAFALYPGSLESIIDELEQGRCALYYLADCGHVVIRIESVAGVKTLVIVAAVGRDAVGGMRRLQACCRTLGIERIRCHCRRKALARIYQRCGFVVSHVNGEWVGLWAASLDQTAVSKTTRK